MGNNMSIEAMKQALEALEEYGEHYKECRYVPYKTLVPQPPCTCGYKESVIALRQAIEQEIEQEPVAYTFSDDVILAKHWTAEDPPSGWTPLYTAPPKRPVKSFTGGIPRYAMDAPIEAKLKDKNT
jgi:hypothetical protein